MLQSVKVSGKRSRCDGGAGAIGLCCLAVARAEGAWIIISDMV